MATEKELIEKLGNVDVDRIDDAYKERDVKADEMMSELIDEEHRLNAWEYDFLHSVIDWTTSPDKKHITFNQFETLIKMHEKYC